MKKIVVIVTLLACVLLFVRPMFSVVYVPDDEGEIVYAKPVDTAPKADSQTPTSARLVCVAPGESVDVSSYFTVHDIVLVAKTIYGEAGADWITYQEKACVAWIICNRVDSPRWENSIEEIVTAENQFHGYSEFHPVTKECYRVAEDVLTRWALYKLGYDVYRELEPEYTAFYGDGKVNYFYEY